MLKLTDAVDRIDTCRLPVLGLTEMDTSTALSEGTRDATATRSAATLELTLPALLGGKLKLPVTRCCCPDGSGGGGGPDTTTRGGTSAEKVIPPAAVPMASLKLNVSIAAAIVLNSTDPLDRMDTCTLPVLGL